MLLDELQTLTESRLKPDWDRLQGYMKDSARNGENKYIFYSDEYVINNELVKESVFPQPIFARLVDKCKSEGLSVEVNLFNNSVTGVSKSTVCW